MLLQTPSEETDTASSSADIRVTPQELALAAAALEARREAETRRRENTLPLTEALHVSGLNATPEELRAEVEAVRAAQITALQKAEKKRHRSRLILGTTTALLLTVFMGMGWSILSLRRSLHQALHPYSALPMQTLAQVPENRVVHADLDTLTRLAGGKITPEQAAVDTRPNIEDAAQPGLFNNEWAVVKTGGGVYVNGWATADYALMIHNNQAAVLFSNRPAWLPPANLVSVQVPLYRFVLPNSYGSPSTEYDSKGAETKIGVTESFTLTDTNEAIRQNIDQVYAERASHLKEDQFKNDSGYVQNDFSIAVAGNVVTLTGSVASASLQKQAVTLAKATLHQLGQNYRIDDQTEVHKPEDN